MIDPPAADYSGVQLAPTDEARASARGIDFARLYEYRFKDVDQSGRTRVWEEISAFVHARMGAPRCVLDPAAGRGEFINTVPSAERWGIDLVEQTEWDPAVRRIIGDALQVDLPDDQFDGVFVSNFLEHLPTQDTVAHFLARMHATLRPGGVIAVMGPNFRFCAKDYFDCADHVLALTHVAVEEHLAAAGFQDITIVKRFLPYSFRGILPPSAAMTRLYLNMPFVWRVLGKQFLVTARRPQAGV